MGSTKESDAPSRTPSTVGDAPARSHEIDEGLWQRFRRWPRLGLWALALSVPILLYGYDNVIVGNMTSVPAFQRHYGKWLDDRFIIPSDWLSVWSVASPIGQMVGSVAGGAFQDRFGRRWSLASSSVVCAAGVFTLASSVLRLPYLHNLNQSEDPTWDITNVVIWSGAEFSSSIIFSCIPTLKPIYTRVRNRYRPHKSTNGSGTSGATPQSSDWRSYTAPPTLGSSSDKQSPQYLQVENRSLESLSTPRAARR